MIITITGMPGSGKGTISRMLAKKYRLPYYSIGNIRRQMAIKRGWTLEKYNQYGETHPQTDLEPDQWATQHSKKTGRGVYDGRTMFHFVKPSYKIFLDCDLTEGAWRIANDKQAKRSHEANLANHQLATIALKRRIASDRRRYRKYYDLDIFDRRHYDLVVDTTHITPAQVLKKIITHLKKWDVNPAPQAHPVKGLYKKISRNNKS